MYGAIEAAVDLKLQADLENVYGALVRAMDQRGDDFARNYSALSHAANATAALLHAIDDLRQRTGVTFAAKEQAENPAVTRRPL